MRWMALAVLPALLWDHGPETIGRLKRAGVACVVVPAGRASAWRESGFCHVAVEPAELQAREKLPAPGVRWEINLASATRSPWVDANGWRFERRPGRRYFYELPKGAAALAAAEAFAYGADAYLRIDPQDLDACGRLLAFLARIDAPRLPARANIGVIDDGSDLVGEVLNLLARRNFLFQVLKAPDARYDLNVRIGSPAYPKSEAADPGAFAEKLRRELTDEKRLLRIYGSDVVLGRLTGDASCARLHLLNYGGERIEGLRIRVRGSYAKGELAAAAYGQAKLEDYEALDGATEFTISEMGVYAVVDLRRQ